MSYKKILVAIDHSPQAEVVFEKALELAKKEEASLMVFHCLPFDIQENHSYQDLFGKSLGNYSLEMQAKREQEREEVYQWLTSYCQKATAQGVLTEGELMAGDAGCKIQELTNSWGADLVVLGRRGRQGLKELFLGSVSNYVVHHVSCSVLVVQGLNPTTDELSEAAT